MAADVNVGRVNAFLTLDTRRFTSGLRRAEANLKRTGQRLTSIGKTAAFALAAPLVGAGVAIVKAAAEFEEEMTKIQTLVGVNKELVDEWRESVENLSLSVAVGPRELAKALFVVTSAGIRGAESLVILEQAAKAATVGLGETKEVARAVTSAVQAFASSGLSAKTATEILVATVREGNLEASSLAASLGRVLAIASQVGASFAQVGAFIATFTRLGVSAEEAVTALRGAFAALLKPSNEGRIALARVSKANDGVAKTFADLRAEISTKGLAPTLVGLIELFKGQEEQLVKVIPRIRALAGILAVASSQAEVFVRIEKKVAESLGILDEAFAIAEKEASVAFRRIGISIELFRVRIGKVLLPAVKDIADAFTRLVTEFSHVDPAIIKTAFKFTIITVGLTGLTIALGLAVQAFAFIGAGLLALGSFLISPIALIGSLAVAIGLLALSFSDAGRDIRTKFVVSLGGIGVIFDDLLTSIEVAVISGLAAIIAPFDRFVDRVISAFSILFAFDRRLSSFFGDVTGVAEVEVGILNNFDRELLKFGGEVIEFYGEITGLFPKVEIEIEIETLGPFLDKNKKILAQSADDIANERTGIIAQMNALLAAVVTANLDRTEAIKAAADKRSAVIKAAADEEAGIIESSQLAIVALINQIKVAALIPIEPGEFAERVGRDVTALRGFLRNLQFGQKEATAETKLFLEVMRKMGLVAEPTIEGVAKAFEGLAKQTQLKLPLKDRLTEAAQDAIEDIESQIKAIEIEIELVGVGQAVADAKRLENAVEELGKEGELRGIKDGGDLLDTLRVKAVKTSLALSRAKGFDDLNKQMDALRLTAKELDLTPAERSANKLVRELTLLATTSGALTASELPKLEEEIRKLSKEFEDAANRITVSITGPFANALGTMFDGFLRGTLESISVLEIFRNAFIGIFVEMFTESLKAKKIFDVKFKENIFELTAQVGRSFLELLGIMSAPIPAPPLPDKPLPDQLPKPAGDVPEFLLPPLPGPLKLPDQDPLDAILFPQGAPPDAMGGGADIASQLQPVVEEMRVIVQELNTVLRELIAVIQDALAPLKQAFADLNEQVKQTGEQMAVGNEELKANFQAVNQTMEQGTAELQQRFKELSAAIRKAVQDIQRAQEKQLFASAPSGGGATGGIISKEMMLRVGEGGPELLIPQNRFGDFSSLRDVATQLSLPKLAEGGIVNKPTIALIAEAGPEAIVPLSKVPSGQEAGDVTIQIFNSTGEPARTEETTGADGHRVIKVMIGRVVEEDLNRGGSIAQSFESTFGLNRRGLRR